VTRVKKYVSLRLCYEEGGKTLCAGLAGTNTNSKVEGENLMDAGKMGSPRQPDSPRTGRRSGGPPKSYLISP